MGGVNCQDGKGVKSWDGDVWFCREELQPRRILYRVHIAGPSPSNGTQRGREGGHGVQHRYAGTCIVQDQQDNERIYYRGGTLF